MNTTLIGNKAESLVAEYLRRQGFAIRCRNWRHPMAEIDIVAQRRQVLFFIEVKYRSQSNQGSGLDYITPRKLMRMTRAAELYVQVDRWRGMYQLLAASVGHDSEVELIEITG